VDTGNIYDLSLEMLAAVVVTDTKIAQPRETVTQKMETIRAGDFEFLSTPQGNLSELLRYTAGQFVNPLSRNDANWGSYAGLGPKYNIYVLDGLPIDSFADSMSLDPWALQEVEIHKGPASVLYSNYLSMDFAGNEMSLAGITNFILKDRIDSESTRIAAGYGSYNTGNARFYHQNRKDSISYFAGGSFERSDYANYGSSGSWLNMLQSPDYRKTKLYAKISYAPDDDSRHLSLFVHRTDHKGNAGRPNRDFRNRYETVNAAYSLSLDDAWNLQIKSGYRNYDREWGEDNYPVNLDLRERDGVSQKIYLSDLTLNYRHAGNSMLTMGADLQRASYETYQVVNDVDARSAGLFVQEKYVKDRWVFRVGGRANRTDQSYETIDSAAPALKDKSWDSQLWSTGVRYNADSILSLYCNVGSSFVAPSAKSVCGTIAASDAGIPGKNGQLPNPGLKPEKGTGSDLGIEVRPDSSFTFGIRGFLNRIDDAIVDNAVSAVPSQSISVNAGRVRSCGFEVTAEQSLSRELKWFANVTRTSSKVKNGIEPDQNGTSIPFVPNLVANSGISIKFPGDIVVSPYLQFVGDYYDSTSRAGRKRFGSYEVLDLKIQGSLAKSPSCSMGYALELNNLLNRRYEMPWQFRNPGFNMFVSFEVGF
jgi:outer membrane receptor for ferrienterochelin and colicin